MLFFDWKNSGWWWYLLLGSWYFSLSFFIFDSFLYFFFRTRLVVGHGCYLIHFGSPKVHSRSSWISSPCSDDRPNKKLSLFDFAGLGLYHLHHLSLTSLPPSFLPFLRPLPYVSSLLSSVFLSHFHLGKRGCMLLSKSCGVYAEV